MAEGPISRSSSDGSEGDPVVSPGDVSPVDRTRFVRVVGSHLSFRGVSICTGLYRKVLLKWCFADSLCQTVPVDNALCRSVH